MKQDQLIQAIFRHYYTKPCEEWLERHAPWYYIFSKIEFTPFELKMSMSQPSDEKFVALMQVRVIEAMWAILEELQAPTLPVHDEPMPEELLLER